MCAAGLIEMPPVSNVTPLPTSATDARGDGPRISAAAPAGACARAAADPEDAAVPARRERLVVEDLDLQAGGLAERRGARREGLGEQVVGWVSTRSRAVVTACATTVARRSTASASSASVARVTRRTAVRPRALLYSVKRVGAQERALGRRGDGVGVGPRQRGHRVVGPGERAGGGPGRAAQLLGRRAVVPGRAEPDGDEQRCGDRAPGRDPDDLVRAARRAREGEQRRQLAAERGVHGGRARGEPGRPSRRRRRHGRAGRRPRARPRRPSRQWSRRRSADAARSLGS